VDDEEEGDGGMHILAFLCGGNSIGFGFCFLLFLRWDRPLGFLVEVIEALAVGAGDLESTPILQSESILTVKRKTIIRGGGG